MNFIGFVGHDQRINQLDCGGDPSQDPDAGFQNVDQDRDPEIFYCPAWLISLSSLIAFSAANVKSLEKSHWPH